MELQPRNEIDDTVPNLVSDDDDHPRRTHRPFYSTDDNRPEPARRNQKENTDNMSIYLANFGIRSQEGSNNDSTHKANVRKMMDQCYQKNPGMITIGLECTDDVTAMLEAPAVAGTPNPKVDERGGVALEDRQT